MRREGLTVTMIFLAESANYGEGVGNITTLKKLSRGNYEQYSYISRQALRYNIVSQLSWDNTPVDEKSGVVQFAPSATIKEYPEIDLFGYMKTTKEGDQKRRGCNQKRGRQTQQRGRSGTLSERYGVFDQHGACKKEKCGKCDRSE